jgi:uncharacterized protein (DUF427 family)
VTTTQTDAGQTDAIRLESSHKRVRVLLAGELVADTTHAILVWENPHYPAYYIPGGDVRAELVPASDVSAEQISGRTGRALGEPEVLSVKVASATAEGAARRYPASSAEELRDCVRFDWGAMSEWLEEDEPVYTHPRSPYTRIDILASSRHVRVELDGVTVADSRSPRILFETGLPARYYLPLTDVRTDLLTPSDTHTSCPYKGTAAYWSVDTGTRVHKDVVWIYRTPLPESQKIAGLACFYNERVEVFVDGEKQSRPKSPFS